MSAASRAHVHRGAIAGALLLAMLVAACGPSDRSRRSRFPDVAEVDSNPPVSTRERFVVPATWERVVNPVMYFDQPPGFTFGLDQTRIDECDAGTPQADVPVLDRGFLEMWPLTLAMRRGDLNQIAATNGFQLDRAVVTSADADSTMVRRGEGWLLLSGRSSVANITFASVRAPGGCYLIWAARGVNLNPDTLGLVLSTLRFGRPPATDTAGAGTAPQ